MHIKLLFKHSAARLVVTALAVGLAAAGSSAQLMEAKEYAAEISRFEFGNAPTTNGLIFVRRCDQCAETGVSFRAQTQYFDGRRAITAEAAEQLSDRGATVMFDPGSRYVTRVVFWPASK